MENYKNKIYNMDCIAGMAMLPDGCVDMALTDLPYGTTAVACRNVGRQYVGFEINEEFYKTAIARLT